MHRLQARVKKLELQIVIADKGDLSRLSDEELEAKIRSLCVKQGIDPTLPN